jgi:glycolate oxidase FAD binding subunit
MEGLSPEVAAALAAVVGPGGMRPGTSADEVGSARPGLVVEPDTPEAVAAVLDWAGRHHHSIVVRGGGTKMDWGRTPDSVDVVLGMGRLKRLLAHAHGDLTATVEGGLSLVAANRALARHGQWLPLESPFEGATIGGVLAANESGPLRHRYGTPRDLLIGVRLATTDGRLVKAGGNVVKNVAGYDLGKLVTGSWGRLAVIVAATFKLAPLPRALRSVRFAFPGGAEAARAAAVLAESQLEPAALDVRFAGARDGSGGTAELLARFASTRGASEAQASEAEGLLRDVGLDGAEHVSGADEVELWRSHDTGIWRAGGAVLRVVWLPARLGAVLGLAADLAREATSLQLVGRVGSGTGFLRLEGGEGDLAETVVRLYTRPDVFERVTVLRADPHVKRRVARSESDRVSALVAAVKGAFDPRGVLGAGF